MRARVFGLFLAVAAAATPILSCKRASAGAPTKQARDNEENPAQKGEIEKKVSDLDRPVEELFAATCEHGKKTFECDECRYEIGVVRAPANLFSAGLLNTAKVERRRVDIPIVLTGEIRFDERRVAHLRSQSEGIVKRVYVTLGDAIKRGQPLLELESVVVGEAQGAYLEALAVHQLAHRGFERQAKLRKEFITSEKEYLQAKQESEAADIRIEASFGKLIRLGMDKAAATALTQETATGRLVLRSPTDGVVLLMHAVPGEVARTEESLLTVGDNSSVWVWADLYERDMATVARAQSHKRLSASIAVKAYPGEEFAGTVDFLSPAMEESSRTVKVRIEANNPHGRLLAGMFANVKIFLPGEDEVLAAPKAAVLEDEGRSFLFLHHHGDYYVRRPIILGRSWAEWVEIKRGLSGGETVVADGAFLMKSDVLRSKMGAGCAD